MQNKKPYLRNKIERVILCLVYLLLIFNVLFFKDSPIAFVSAFLGITYTFLAGKGNPICYLFGVMGSCFYGYLAFHNALWGNLILYMAYFVPMQILGFFRWNKHLKDGKNEIVKIRLSNKDRVILYSTTIFFTIISVIILFYMQDKNPVIDGITTIFSIAGMFLTVKRAIEQWHVWMIVNGLSAIMWLIIALNGEKVYSTVIMWSVYFILAIYFYFIWKKELGAQKS